MATLETEVRLARLEAVVRLRRFGLWPWIALIGWAFFAAGQEPALLRGFGVHLTWQGIWSGATILLVALACSGGGANKFGRTGPHWIDLRSSATTLALVGLALVTLVAVAQAGVAWLADRANGHPSSLGTALVSAGGFLVALTPASIAGACLAPRWSGSWAAKLVLVTEVGFSLSLSAVCFSAPSVAAAAASLLAATGAVGMSAMIASRQQ